MAAAGAALAAAGGARAAYSAERPQRVLLFHTRRTDHARSPPAVEHFFWMPEIDANTPHSLAEYGRARATRRRSPRVPAERACVRQWRARRARRARGRRARRSARAGCTAARPTTCRCGG